MPVFELELTDGRKFQLETDRPPTEAELPDLLKQLGDSSSIQELNPTESLRTSPVFAPTGIQSVMNPPNLANVGTMQNMIPLGGGDEGNMLAKQRRDQYQALAHTYQQINAKWDEANANIHYYPFEQAVRKNLGGNPTVFTGQVDPIKTRPLFPNDPQMEEIYKENESNRQKELANLALTAKNLSFDKTPGTDIPDITKPMQTFGIRPQTVQKALGTGETASKVIAGAQQVAASVPEMFTSPMGVGTLPLLMPKLVGPTVSKVVGGAFVADMASQIPEQAAVAKRAIEQGDVEGATRALGHIALTGVMIGKGVRDEAGTIKDAYQKVNPLNPEVLPPEPARVMPPSRQLMAPIIDVETLGQPLLPQARRFYQSESKNPPVDASQLTQNELNARLKTYKPLPPMEPKKAYTGEQVIIGENEPQNIAKELGLRYDGLQDWGKQIGKREVFTSLDKNNPFTIYVNEGTTRQEVAARLAEKQKADVKQPSPVIVPANVATKAPIEQAGGKVSFAAPAESGAIPSARQAALPEQGQKASSPQAPQMGQGEKMIASEAQDSQAKSKAPINERDQSDSKNESDIEFRNTGPLTKKQQDWITSSARKLLSSPKDLKYSPDRKGEYDGGQLVNRLLNNVPPGEKEVLEQAGIREKFKPGQKVSSEEVDKWIAENEPKVEVRKFRTKEGEGLHPDQTAFLNFQHSWFDNLTEERQRDVLANNERNIPLPDYWNEADKLDAKRYHELFQKSRAVSYDPYAGKQANWQSVAPKPESEMKDYVEIAVVKPTKGTPKKEGKQRMSLSESIDYNDSIKFPSSHNFPPNTFGFVRGYMEGDTFHVIEVQKDTIINNHDGTYQVSGHPEFGRKLTRKQAEDFATQIEPLNAYSANLALKAAIEHARSQGAKRIAIQDAESAMLMEGHDRAKRTIIEGTKENADRLAKEEGNNHPDVVKLREGRSIDISGSQFDIDDANALGLTLKEDITQEKGMRLHYDQILPKLLKELTGQEGEKVSFGEHKMAVDKDPLGQFNQGKSSPRKDLIFRNPDGTPKTDITALSFPLDKVSEAQSKAPFTTMGSDKVKMDKDEQGNIVYYHSGIPAPKEAIKAVKDMLTLGGKALNLYAEPIVEKLGRVGGPVAKKATEEFQRMISRQKQVYGELSPVVDAAKKATGKMGGGNMWLRKVNNITDKAGVNNMFASNEGGPTPPSEARQAVQSLDRANLAIGNAAKLANPDFVPSGKLQRVLTNYGYDIIKRGNGPAWEAWTEGVANANGAPVNKVREFFSKWKEELDKPASDVASMDRISQDFSRKFPKTVTHIKPGVAWHEVVVADPFNYIESAAQRTSHAVAFREVYPLVRDPNTGKLGPSGYLQNTRKAIQKELNTAGFDANLFDNLVSAVQGHPLDTFTRGWNAPDSPLGAGYRMGQQVLSQPLKTLMLTANTISNAGEILSGGPAIFLGYHNVLPAMVKLAADNKLAGYLEFIGARNKAMYNFSFDPTSPVRSTSRIVSSALRKATAQQLFNEIQETTAAMSAKFVADKIRNKDISTWEQGRIKAVARVMGFNEKQATDLVNGDSDLLRQFETKSAAMLTSGNQAMAEKSRLGTSRAFNELFWFQTYPQMKANQARKILGNFFEDISNRNWSQMGHNAALAGRFIGGTGAQGVITLLLMGLATAGIYGLKQKKQQAEEETWKFTKSATISGMGGPLAILMRLAQNSKDSKSLTQGLVSLSPVVSSGQDLIDVLAGTGRYEGRTVNERISMFLDSKSPGLDIAKTILSVSGLSQDDLKLRSDIKGFYSWRREQDGYKPASAGGGDEADIQLRTQMKRVKEAMQQGKDWMGELEKVKDLVYAQHSLRAGTMLELNSKPLSDEQLSSLEKRIGKEGVERLKTYDAMLRQVARELGDVNKEKKDLRDIKPIGDKYVDQTTESQRSEKVARLVKPETMQFLEANKKKVPSFEPSYGLTKKELMSKEQGEMYEQILAEEVDKRLASKMTNSVFASKPLVKRQAEIEDRLELAKEIAATRFRAKTRQQALSQ